jgi:hypothetical protein
MIMTERVRASIERLYEAFGDVPRPASIDFCDHCRTADELEPLLRKDLRELTGDDMYRYAHSAMLTVGSEEDFVYYCPRLLDLVTQEAAEAESFDMLDLEIVLDKLSLANWKKWPENKRSAVLEWADAVFAAMGEVVFVLGVDSWICGMAKFLDDIAARLSPLLEKTSEADQNLVGFFEENSERLLKHGKLSSAFWEESNPNFAPVAAWLRSESVTKRLDVIHGTEPV